MPLIFTVVAVPYVCFYRVYLARDFSEAEPRVLWSRKIIWPPPMLSNQQNWPPLLELTVHGNLRRVFGHFWGWSLALCFCDRSSLSYAGSLPFALILHNSLLRQVRNDLQLFPWNSCLQSSNPVVQPLALPDMVCMLPSLPLCNRGLCTFCFSCSSFR